MNDDAPCKTYWWVRHRRDGNVEIALRAGAWWYAVERCKSYSTDTEICREYELLEPAPVPVFREELRYVCRNSQGAHIDYSSFHETEAVAADAGGGDWVNGAADADGKPFAKIDDVESDWMAI
jgi:hypothetical protein